MANLFDGINKMTDDQIRMQIALFDNVNLPNAAKETGFRFMSGLADVANAFAETFVSKTVFDYEYKKVSDMVKDRYEKLMITARNDLEAMLRLRMIEIIRGLLGKEIGEDICDEELSKYVINAAAEVYQVNKYLTPAHKVQEIGIKYNDAFLLNVQNLLKKMNEAQIKEHAKYVDEKMKKVPIEVKRQVQEALMPAQFNGIGIINVLRAQKNVSKLELIMQLLGREAFMSIEAEVATIYQALRNFSRISRAQMARLIWISAESFGKKFYIEQDLLPSYIPANEKEDRQAKEQVYRVVVGQVLDANAEVLKCEKEVEAKNHTLDEAREKYERASKEYDDSQMKFTRLESQKDDYIRKLKPEDETRSYYNNVNETKRELDRNAAEYERRKKKLHEAVNDCDIAKVKLDESKKQYEVIEASAKEQINSRAEDLKRKWTAYFFRFSFEDSVFENVVKEFLESEILMLEQMLKEANDSKTMAAVSEDDNRILVSVGIKKPAIIEYEDRKITAIHK